MRYRTTSAFDHDFARLPAEHRQLLREHFLPAIVTGAFGGTHRWPRPLRIHRLTGTSIYSLTWNSIGSDGRATFHLEKGPDEEPVPV